MSKIKYRKMSISKKNYTWCDTRENEQFMSKIFSTNNLVIACEPIHIFNEEQLKNYRVDGSIFDFRDINQNLAYEDLPSSFKARRSHSLLPIMCDKVFPQLLRLKEQYNIENPAIYYAIVSLSSKGKKSLRGIAKFDLTGLSIAPNPELIAKLEKKELFSKNKNSGV